MQRRILFLLAVSKLLCVLGILVITPNALADWINLTGAETAPNIAEIYIQDDHVKLVLEVYIGDLKVFDDLVPDDWLSDPRNRLPLTERLRRFSADTFQFVTDTGHILQAERKMIEPGLRTDRQSPFAGMINPITRQRVPEAPTDKRVLYAELVYPFQGKPAVLTIVPPLDEGGRPLVTIGFIAYHKAVPIIDFRYLGAAARLTLDWADPWYTKFDNPNLKRHHKDGLMSFLYVEPYEVRHEILSRVKDLDQWMDLGLRGTTYIELDELEPLKQRIGEFFLGKNRLLIDGQPAKPILDRANYVKVALTGIQLVEQPQRLEISTAIVGVILAYITDGLPQQVAVEWELFTDQIQKVPTTAIDPAGPLLTYVTPDDTVHTWTNYLKTYVLPQVEAVVVADALATFSLPVGSLVCLTVLIPLVGQIRTRRKSARPVRTQVFLASGVLMGSILISPYFAVSVARPAPLTPRLTETEAQTILHSLLKNVYRAFDFRAEEDVYDKLALTVSGDLLADIYLQNRKSLAIQKAGGAQAKVNAVELLDVKVESVPERPLVFALQAQWTASGSVGHWGHVHTRTNRYEAIVTVEPVAGAWKISKLELLDEQRIDPNAQKNL